MILKITGGEVLIDDDLFPKISQLAWHVMKVGYAVHTAWIRQRRQKLLMHRYIFELEGVDIPSGMQIDHHNRNRLDNRFQNLRIVTISQQRANSSHRNKTGYNGVSYWTDGKYEYYRGAITKDHKCYITRYVETPEEAARLRDELAKQLFGEFAIQNFPKP